MGPGESTSPGPCFSLPFSGREGPLRGAFCQPEDGPHPDIPDPAVQGPHHMERINFGSSIRLKTIIFPGTHHILPAFRMPVLRGSDVSSIRVRKDLRQISWTGEAQMKGISIKEPVFTAGGRYPPDITNQKTLFESYMSEPVFPTETERKFISQAKKYRNSYFYPCSNPKSSESCNQKRGNKYVMLMLF